MRARLTSHRLCLAMLFTLAPLFATASDAPARDTLLLPDRVWTADGDAAHPGWAVLVHDGKVAAVGPADTDRKSVV